MADPKTTRGYLNHNPGNIDFHENIKWNGLVGRETRPDGSPGRFCVFQTHEYGIRAIAMNLLTGQDRYGKKTIRDHINRWAPPIENSTNNYIDRVDAVLKNHGPDDFLDLHVYENMRDMVVGIITVELGGQPYTDRQIDDGLRMAGLPKPVVTVTQAATTQTGQGAVAVGGAAGAAAVAAAAAQAAPAITALGSLAPWVGALVVAIVACAAIYFVLKNRKDKETV